MKHPSAYSGITRAWLCLSKVAPLFWKSLVNQKEFNGALGAEAVRKITKKCQRIGFIDLGVAYPRPLLNRLLTDCHQELSRIRGPAVSHAFALYALFYPTLTNGSIQLTAPESHLLGSMNVGEPIRNHETHLCKSVVLCTYSGS